LTLISDKIVKIMK